MEKQKDSAFTENVYEQNTAAFSSWQLKSRLAF